jgi:hypothetical protein
MEKLLEHLGFATPFIYAAAAYGLFRWLDDNASDEAKAALARTMRLKDYKNEQVASALVEVFDRIYTYPLLRWRAFGRSFLFTTVVSAVYGFEMGIRPVWEGANFIIFPMIVLFNALTDYLSLFVIRRVLIRSGTKPVIGLALGIVSGAAIVLGVNELRNAVFLTIVGGWEEVGELVTHLAMWGMVYRTLFFSWPAFFVFAWLPLFAVGILTARFLTPLSWIVGRTQWFLKEGKEHPLKAIGYAAAVVVFLGTVVGRPVFSA